MTTSGNVQIIAGTVLLVAILAAITGLALHGSITGTVAMAGIGTIITLGGGVFGVHLGVNAGAKAVSMSPSASPPSPAPTSTHQI